MHHSWCKHFRYVNVSIIHVCYSHDSLGVVSRGRGWIFYKPSYFLTRIFSWVSFSSGYVVLLILASLCFTRHCFGIHAKKKVGKYETMNSSCALNVAFSLPCVCVFFFSIKKMQKMGSVWFYQIRVWIIKEYSFKCLKKNILRNNKKKRRKEVCFYRLKSSASVNFFFIFSFNFHNFHISCIISVLYLYPLCFSGTNKYYFYLQ